MTTSALSKNGNDRYLYDIDIFTEELTKQCRDKLEGYAVISFRDCGSPMTRTEEKLGERLVEECRLALKLKGITTRRNIYFGGSGAQKAQLGLILLAAGHSATAVADALNVTRSTVARWGPSKRERGAPGHSATPFDEEIYKLGLKKFCENHEVDYTSKALDTSLEALAQVLWVRPDKLRRRVLCAGWAVNDLTQLLDG